MAGVDGVLAEVERRVVDLDLGTAALLTAAAEDSE